MPTRRIDDLSPGPWSRPTSRSHVRRLLAATGPLAPVMIDPAGRIVDGRHRVEALRESGHDTVDCTVIHHDDEAAYIAAFITANSAHGLPLRLADRRRAATALLDLPVALSDRRIALLAGLSPTTVGRLRRLQPTATEADPTPGPDPTPAPGPGVHNEQLDTDATRQPPPSTPARRTGIDGRQRTADPAGQRAAIHALAAHTSALTVSDIARRTGASRSTVTRTLRGATASGPHGGLPHRRTAKETAPVSADAGRVAEAAGRAGIRRSARAAVVRWAVVTVGRSRMALRRVRQFVARSGLAFWRRVGRGHRNP